MQKSKSVPYVLVLECACVSLFVLMSQVCPLAISSLFNAYRCLCVGSCVASVFVHLYPLCFVKIRRPLCFVESACAPWPMNGTLEIAQCLEHRSCIRTSSVSVCISSGPDYYTMILTVYIMHLRFSHNTITISTILVVKTALCGWYY